MRTSQELTSPPATQLAAISIQPSRLASDDAAAPMWIASEDDADRTPSG